MSIKDHYATLEIETSATLQEIKKAYRRLAQQFHPDKNHNDAYAAARFTEIKEAYEVLTDPGKKEQYLQHRWYEQSMGIKRKQQSVTPFNILKQTLELDKYVSKLDVFRMDKYGLHDYIISLLDNDTIEKLNGFKEQGTNDQVVCLLINCMKVLPLNLVLSLYEQIKKLDISKAVREKLYQFISSKKRSNQRDKYRIVLIIITVIVLCLIILLAA